MRSLLRLAIAVLALAQSPLGLAHVEPRPLLQRVDADRVLSLEVVGGLLVAGEPTGLVAEVVNFTTGQHPPGARLRLVLDEPGADAPPLDVPLEEAEPGHFRGVARVGSAGEWTATLVEDASGARARLPLRAYLGPAVRYAWSPASATDAFAGEETRFVFLVLDAGGMPVARPLPSGVARVEAVAVEEARVPARVDVPLAPTGAAGELVLVHVFPAKGHYRLLVGVPHLGLMPGDRPAFDVRVGPPALAPLGPEPERETPLPLALALAAVLVAARAARGYSFFRLGRG